MKNIGIVGSGIAGLQLGLFLRQQGIAATIYTEQTPAQQLGSRLPALVARAGHTRTRERQLGINHWDGANNEFGRIHIYVSGDQPLAFYGNLMQPFIAVDMRIYCGRLLEDFAARGGRVVIGAVQAGEVAQLVTAHDLLVVATGRGGLTELFPRMAMHSPFTRPQRLLCSGLFRGVAPAPGPPSASVTFVPQHGEIFDFPIYSFEPHVTGMGFEAVPGGAFEALVGMRYAEHPRAFEGRLLSLLREYAPALYTRIDPARFGLTRPLDLLQGGVTPTVRRGYTPLGNGRWALALGDVHIVNDPLTGQGANTASYAAWLVGEAIRDGEIFDEAFCQRLEQRVWAYAGPIVAWTNAMLQPPQPHMIDLLVAAAQDQTIADAFANFFERPLHAWEILSSPAHTAAFLEQHGWQGLPGVKLAA